MNERKRLSTALGLSATVFGLLMILTMAKGSHANGIRTLFAKEPAPHSEEHDSATPSGLHSVAVGPQASPTPLEILKDRCSTSVRIEPSLIFSPNQGTMVPGSQAPIRIRRPADKDQFTPLTDKLAVGLTPSGRFAWFCGSNANNSGGTLEHSNCPQGTNAMRAQLGPNRLLRIQCLPN